MHRVVKSKKIYTNKVVTLISFLYFILLVYNVVSAKVIPSLITLFLFLLTGPIFFRKFKAIHHAFFRKLNIIVLILMFIPLIFSLVPLILGKATWTEETIPAEEQYYIDTILSQITTESTKEEAIVLLGKPDRDHVYKVNWWVSIEGRKSRVGIYFSPSTGKANEIVLDGGMGKFYYRKKLETLSP